MKTLFRQVKDGARGIEPAPAPMIASGNPNVLEEAKECKKGGKVKVRRKAGVAMEGKPVRQRADRPRRAAGGQLQALPQPVYMQQQPALAPASGVGGAPYQIAGGGLARGGMTKRRRRDDIREGDSVRPRQRMED